MTTLKLSDRLDLSQVAKIAQDFAGHRHEDLSIDASGVTHLGALGLQLLLSARNSWRAEGKTFEVAPRSEEFDAALASFGFKPEDFHTSQERVA